MHWSLVEFDAPLVGNGDQPIVVFPMLRACETARIEALPRTGFMDSVEVRIALDPHHILLLTWLDAVEDGTVVHGTFAQAADINRATFAQADRHWFYRPGTHPPRLSPPMLERACQEISYDLLPGYSLDAAFHAQRRAEASELMRSFAEDQVTHAMRWVTFRAVSPVALSPSVSQPAVASQG
jgi:hypothetical protein